MSYKSLEIWRLSRDISIIVHRMILEKLPDFETYETGRQIRKSSKTVRSCIVEGYGRRKYKGDWIKFLVYSLSSNDEKLDHLETLFKTKSLIDNDLYNQLHEMITLLGKKLNKFLQSVERQHLTG
ncbi:MAG TPA: four helix bundle protein [Flavilitoribacter sp.]|nr:four helix bundle protein [Flavilitoribacter sp.]HMQ90978.1 four helix bundle protein [Flavilitoribacter sp.]